MEEQIKKLNQLDRIEYRIKELSNGQDYSFIFENGLLLGIYFITLLTSVQIVLFQKGLLEQYLPRLVLIVIFIHGVTLAFIFFSIGYYIISSRKLEKEYFQVLVK